MEFKKSTVYKGSLAVLTTKHQKFKAIATPMRAGLGLNLLTVNFDTDTLGTFTGEVERKGSARENALKKARIGMAMAGKKLGIASEGSFGPHPLVPFLSAGEETMAFIDDKLKIEVVEQMLSLKSNFAHCSVQRFEELSDFLKRVKFPSHAVIVRPNFNRTNWVSNLSSKLGISIPPQQIFKGITNQEELQEAFEHCRTISEDGLVLIQSDMRAHLNPTRLRLIRQLAIKLARRLAHGCSVCGCPGWGVTGVVSGLPCRDCRFPSDLPKLEVFACPSCTHQETLPRRDGVLNVDPMNCEMCNP